MLCYKQDVRDAYERFIDKKWLGVVDVVEEEAGSSSKVREVLRSVGSSETAE